MLPCYWCSKLTCAYKRILYHRYLAYLYFATTDLAKNQDVADPVQGTLIPQIVNPYALTNILILNEPSYIPPTNASQELYPSLYDLVSPEVAQELAPEGVYNQLLSKYYPFLVPLVR